MLDVVLPVSPPNMAADPNLRSVLLLKRSQFVSVICYVWSLGSHAG